MGRALLKEDADTIEEVGGGRKHIQLFQDGTLVFRAAADGSFLGWGVEETVFAHFPRLNPVPIVEVHLSFVLLYREILNRLSGSADNISIVLRMENGLIGDQPLLLTEYRPRFNELVDPRIWTLQKATWEEPCTFSAQEVVQRPEKVAADLLIVFADHFDMAPERIPFTKLVEGERLVDIEALKRL